MVNTTKLKLALQSKNITIEQASDAIGIDPSTFYRRINRNGERFTVSEVSKLAQLLDMDAETMQSIFFVNELAAMQEGGQR